MEAHPHWMLRLKLRHLEVFIALVESGSQSATAERLHITQPALSKWLRELEDSAGCALLERGRPLRLTVFGEVLLRYARRVLGDSARTRAELDALRAGTAGHVRVGVLRAVAPILVPRAIVACRGRTPRVRITIDEDSLDNLLPKLRRHELDCVIGRLQGEALVSDIHSEALYEEPVCAVVRIGHPLLRHRRVGWAMAASYPWILPGPQMPMRVGLEAQFTAAGLPAPVDAVESVSLIINEKLLKDTDMISVVSRQLAVHYAAGGALAILPLPMRHLLGPVGLLWIDETPTQAVAGFLDDVRGEARRLQVEQRSAGVRGDDPATPAGRRPEGRPVARSRRTALS